MRSSLTWEDFYGLQRFGMTPDLENIQRFCKRLGHPELSFPSVHIGGTNGKGSVTAILDSILRCSGLKVGMYTSPHLRRFEERIRVNGEQISERQVFDFLEAHWDFIQDNRCTFFETATAMALDYFHERKVQIAVVEVGLGGTYDATRVVQSILSILTSIDFDHTDRLGSTLEQITRDKAGIFRLGHPAFTAAQHPEVSAVLKEQALRLGAHLMESNTCVTFQFSTLSPQGIFGSAKAHLEKTTYSFTDLHCPLTGTFQLENLKLALVASLWLKKRFKGISRATILKGCAQVSWPGRLQEVKSQPTLIVDVAHNPAAVLATLRNVQEIWRPKRIVTIFSALRDKDVLAMARHLKDYAVETYLVPLSGVRGMSLEELTSLAQQAELSATPVATIPEALQRARSRVNPDEVILALGSHYLVQEVLKSEDFS